MHPIESQNYISCNSLDNHFIEYNLRPEESTYMANITIDYCNWRLHTHFVFQDKKVKEELPPLTTEWAPPLLALNTH